MNSATADRQSNEFRAFTILSRKTKKTVDDEARLAEMSWAMALYLDPEQGPYIPGKNIKKLLQEAAAKWKKGADIQRSLVVPEYRVSLIYDGPRDQEGLWDKDYIYTAMVQNAGSGGRVIRHRPCFEDWGLTTELAWDSEDIDYDVLKNVVERSQKYGLGDYRPEFGTFNAELGPETIYKGGAVVNGSRYVDDLDLTAHKASVKRIKG